MCYYQFYADNSTFKNNFIDYSYKIKLTINMMTGVELNFFNGTSLLDAGSRKSAATLYDTFTYEALYGNKVFVHVKGS